MRIKIVGKVHRKGTSKKTGTDYNFIELHYVAPAYGVIGEEAATTTIDPDTYPFDKIVPGVYSAEFDSHGRMLTLAPVQSTPSK